MFVSAAAVFWMYNDCWPTTRSWTIVDHRLRRTPAFHHVRRALAPIGVVVAEANGEIIVTGINDTAETVSAELRFGVMALSGGWPLERIAAVTLAPNAATRLGSFPASEWKDPRTTLAAATLTRAGAVIARNRLMRARLHEHAWPTARPTATVRDGIATFTSEVFAWAVCIERDGERPVDDNHFDLWPGLPHRMPWPFAEPPRILSIGMQEEPSRFAAASGT
jgi:beta-mannosidase